MVKLLYQKKGVVYMLKEYTLNLREAEFDILLGALEKAKEAYHNELRQLDCHTDEYLEACDIWAGRAVALMIVRKQLMEQNM